MLESESQIHILNERTTSERSDGSTDPHSLVATQIDVQALPHNNQGITAFEGAGGLAVTFALTAAVPHRSISIEQSIAGSGVTTTRGSIPRLHPLDSNA